MATTNHQSTTRAIATDSVRSEAAGTLEPVEIIAQLVANAAQRCWENREREAVEGNDNDTHSSPNAG